MLRVARETRDNEIPVSAVSRWNAAIKVVIGKLAMDLPALIGGCVRAGFRIIELSQRHLGRLPPPGKYLDPFDHLLLAQAVAADACFVTAEPRLGQYGASILAG